MAKLSDTQCILLSTASQRDSGSVYPLPAGMARNCGLTSTIAALLKRALIEERVTTDTSAIHRADRDFSYALHVTSAGMAAIGIEPAEVLATGEGPSTTDGEDETSSVPAKTSKSASVVELLCRPEGATMAELIDLTGWLPHTTRAALTGLRNKGHDIARVKRDGATCYCIAGVA